MSLANIEACLLRLALPDATTAPDLPPLSTTDFTRLGQLARDHGVLPAVVMNAAKLTSHNVAPLQESLLAPAALAITLRIRLAPILAALRQRDVSAVVLRGPDFADRLYPQPGLRLFTDLDILVPRARLDDAGEALRALGYELRHIKNLKHADPYGEQLWKHPDHGQEQVEIHWNLVNSPALQQRVSVELADLSFEPGAQRLSPASLLLMTAVHGATSHSFDRLQILCDIRQIARLDVDAAALAAACRRTGSVFSVVAGLALAERAFRDDACRRLRRQLAADSLFARCVLTPRVVLRSGLFVNKWRRQLFRQLLKSRRGYCLSNRSRPVSSGRAAFSARCTSQRESPTSPPRCNEPGTRSRFTSARSNSTNAMLIGMQPMPRC
ncbi:MAG: nucleotidyltransferase family protein [Verrucomicrobia bacterium]|nr:nucleotidyltransferase family protein [Verrucomicrobiota bacterium]